MCVEKKMWTLLFEQGGLKTNKEEHFFERVEGCHEYNAHHYIGGN
jgi:hypothetical protein